VLALGFGTGAPQRARTSGWVILAAALALALVLCSVPARAADPITPLRDIHRGLHCTARTVVQGTTISSFDVDVIDVVAAADGEDARILVRVSGPAVAGTGIGEGFSGSPVYCPNAQGQIGNAGAISETVGQYGEDVGLVTPIEQMLGLPVLPPSSVRTAPRLLRTARPLAAPLVVAGLAPSLARLVERSARLLRRPVVVAPAGPLGSFPPQPLIPGASLSVLLSSGAVTAGAIGTVTYRNGPTIYAFGHPLDGAGRRALPLGDAYVFTVIGNPLDTAEATSYKLAAPSHVLGTLTDDGLDGVVGLAGSLPPTIPVIVTVRDRDLHRTLRQQTDAADETDVGNPAGISALDQVAPAAIAQAIATAFNGAPARETGQLCLHIHVRELHGRMLRFCKRYVINGGAVDPDFPAPLAMAMANDVSAALAMVEGARYARLHVTAVMARVTIARGLRFATIRGARGPRTVRPGHTARVALRVRIFQGPMKTLRFRLLIPPDVPSGVQDIRFTGTPLDGDGGDGPGGGFIAALLGISDSSGPDQPQDAQSGAELLAAVDSMGGYDGVTAKLDGERWHAYRSGRFRLDGSATLTVRVVRRHHHRHRRHHGGGLGIARRRLAARG
jgi:hypothetical protein